jgi:hypothetical protein
MKRMEFLQPDGSRVHGAETLRNLYEAVTSAMDSEIVFDSKRVENSPDLAYRREQGGLNRRSGTPYEIGKSKL